jgi:hypothetical protein
MIREDRMRAGGFVYMVNDPRDANIVVSDTTEESRHMYDNLLRHPPGAFRIDQHGERFQLYCNDVQIMNARPKFSQVNDENIRNKLTYTGDSETIAWLMRTNPFRHNVAMYSVKRYMKTSMLEQSEMNMNKKEEQFMRRFTIRDGESARQYRNEVSPEILAIFQEGEEIKPDLLTEEYELIHPEIVTTSSESDNETKEFKESEEDKDFYAMIMKSAEEDDIVEFGTPDESEVNMADIEISREFMDSVLPTFTKRQEMILTEGLGFYNRANLQVRLYMLDIFGTDRISNEAMISCMIGIVKEKASVVITEYREKQMLNAVVKALMKASVSMGYHLTTERIKNARVQPTMISSSYQCYFEEGEGVFEI